jgi:hypothetical protein
VLPKTNTVDLVMSHPEAPRGSHLPWPKKGTVFMDGPTFVLMDTRPRSPQLGEPWIRITPVRVVPCDGVHGCEADIAHIDEKGWAYCDTHVQSNCGHRHRRLTAAEKLRLEHGLTIWYDPEMNL